MVVGEISSVPSLYSCRVIRYGMYYGEYSVVKGLVLWTTCQHESTTCYGASQPREWTLENGGPRFRPGSGNRPGARPLISDRRVLLDEIRRDPSVGTNNNNNIPFPRPFTLALQYRSVGCEISETPRGKTICCCQLVWRTDAPCRAPRRADGTNAAPGPAAGNAGGCGQRLTLAFYLCIWQSPSR
jgi:hypothetical protein